MKFAGTSRKVLLAGLLAALMVFCAHAASAAATRSNDQPATNPETQWGIRPVSLRLTGADHFIDFRYRVTDPDKAASLMSRKEKAFLVEQETGRVFPVPVTKLGPLRATAVKPKPEREYVILFTNVNKMIKTGSKVSVVIGDFKAENLTVSAERLDKGELSQAQQEKWETLQQNLRQERAVCEEHCGGDTGCLDKCEKAYKSRLEREYKSVISNQ